MDWSWTTFYLSPIIFLTNEKEQSAKVKEHLEPLINSQNQRDVLLTLLRRLFPERMKLAFGSASTENLTSESYRIQKRITHPDAFFKYFTLRVSPSDIPLAYLNDQFNVWRSLESPDRLHNIKVVIMEFKRISKLKTFFDKLRAYQTLIPNEVVLDLIRALYTNINEFSLEGTEDLWNSEWDKAEFLISYLINNKVDNEKIEAVLEDIIANTPSILLIDNLVYVSLNLDANGNYHRIYSSANKGRLALLASERFKAYFVEGRRNIFDFDKRWRFIIYHWATNWSQPNNTNFRIVNDYLLTLYNQDTANLIQVIDTRFKFNSIQEFERAYDSKQLKIQVAKYIDENRFTDEEKKIAQRFIESFPPEQPISNNSE